MYACLLCLFVPSYIKAKVIEKLVCFACRVGSDDTGDNSDGHSEMMMIMMKILALMVMVLLANVVMNNSKLHGYHLTFA